MAAIETRTVEAEEAGMRLDRWFKTHYPDLSFGHLQKLLRSGQIRVDGGRVKTNARLEAGQSVRVPPLAPDTLPRDATTGEGDAARLPGRGRSGRPDDATFLRSITLYEDNQVLVLNKPAGLAVQGGSGLTRHVDAMLEALRDRKGQKPRLVHR